MFCHASTNENKGIDLFEAKNYQKLKVNSLHEKVTNQRIDFLNKLSTEMIKKHDVVYIENLNTIGMLRNHKLSNSILDFSWSSFVTKLQYKADKWFPSSHICSECGHKDGKKSLEIREYTCPICYTHHDRDINANIHILTEDLRLHSMGLV